MKCSMIKADSNSYTAIGLVIMLLHCSRLTSWSLYVSAVDQYLLKMTKTGGLRVHLRATAAYAQYPNGIHQVVHCSLLHGGMG